MEPLFLRETEAAGPAPRQSLGTTTSRGAEEVEVGEGRQQRVGGTSDCTPAGDHSKQVACHANPSSSLQCPCHLGQQSLTFLAPGRQFFPRVGDGFGMIQACYIYCVLHFYYYDIISTLYHQVLDPRGLGPLI